MSNHRAALGIAVIASLSLLAGSCSGDDDGASSTHSQQTQPHASSTTSESTPATTGSAATSPMTVPAATSTTVTATAPATMAPLPTGEDVAFSLPPVFAAVGVDILVVVSVDLDATGVDVIDASGAVLTSLLPASPQFWMGAIPGSADTGPELAVTPVARTGNGQSIDGPPAAIVVLPANGAQLERRAIDAITTVVYDRPFSSDEGELDWIPAKDEGISINPPASPVSTTTRLPCSTTLREG